MYETGLLYHKCFYTVSDIENTYKAEFDWVSERMSKLKKMKEEEEFA